MSNCGPSQDAKPTTSLDVENFIEGEASPAIVNVALQAVKQHSEAFKAAGVTGIRLVPFIDNMIAIEPVGGNKEKSDAVVETITRDLTQAAQQIQAVQAKLPLLNNVELDLPKVVSGAIERCPGSALQVVIDARPPAERIR